MPSAISAVPKPDRPDTKPPASAPASSTIIPLAPIAIPVRLREKSATFGRTTGNQRLECTSAFKGPVMRRRRFVANLLGVPAVALPMLYAEADPEGQARARAFREGLE